MKRVIVLQTRMTSTRLPGKVLMDVTGRPMLVQQLRRLARCRQADEIVVATTTNATDDPVVAVARTEGVRWFRGSETDVLGRYAGAAREAKAEVVVRVTADCPLIDPDESDRVIEALTAQRHRCDYASNVVQRTFPQGLDTEAMYADTLERLDRLAQSSPAREHVTYFILNEHPELFRIHSVTDTENNADLRWTVDMPQDLEMVRTLYRELNLGERTVGYREILAYVRAHPAVAAVNTDAMQKQVS
jgi:spore coat polysaccharide biosynthesis protein SpsF